MATSFNTGIENPSDRSDERANLPKKFRLQDATPLLLTLLSALLLALYCHRRVAGLINPDAMDLAQIGRNLLGGHGLATDILRPLALTGGTNPLGQPDLTHGPLYPLLLALAFGMAGARDGVVIGMSGLFFLLTVPALYFLGRRLFSPQVGLLAALVFMTNSAILDYAVSGTSTTLVMFLATCLFFTLYRAANLARKGGEDPAAQPARAPFLLAGLLSALLYLTDPLFLFMLPVLAIAVALMPPAASPKRRATASTSFALPWLLLALPCMLRFGLLTGNPLFGLRGQEFWMDTKAYPGLLAYRLSPHEVTGGLSSLGGILLKLCVNSSRAIESLQKLPASWILLFVMPSLFFGFADPALSRLRNCVLACLVSVFVGSLFLTFGMNLVMVAFPGLLIFALHYLTYLGHQAKLSKTSLVTASALFGIVLLVPLAAVIATTPQPATVSQATQARALRGQSRPGEVVFSDQPWIVAWYADRPSVWIPVQDARITDLRRQFVDARWLFLTDGARSLSPEWNQAFNSLMQWEVQFQFARERGLPTPDSYRIIRGQAPITAALEGFAPVAPTGNDVPTAVVASVVQSAGQIARK